MGRAVISGNLFAGPAQIQNESKRDGERDHVQRRQRADLTLRIVRRHFDALGRLPLCPSASLPLLQSITMGCAFISEVSPAVE